MEGARSVFKVRTCPSLKCVNVSTADRKVIKRHAWPGPTSVFEVAYMSVLGTNVTRGQVQLLSSKCVHARP